jgi:hypothetical protein
MTFSYAIQSHQNEAPLVFSAPVLTQHAMVIVPDTIAVSKVENLEAGGETRIADTDVNYYMAQGVPPGVGLQIDVAALTAQHASATPMGDYAGPPSDSPSSDSMIKWVAAGGGTLILLAAGALLLFRRGSATS